MARKSARVLGKELGMGPHKVNLVLEKLGLLRKSKYVTQNGQVIWKITPKGAQFGEPSKNYEHTAIWDEEVVDLIRKNADKD